MTKTEIICSLIVMTISLIAAVIFLSDRISERDTSYRNLKTVLAFILSGYSSFGIATFLEYFYSPDFKVWEVFLIGFSIFSVYFVVSVTIGLYKMRKDETEKFRKKINNIEEMKRCDEGANKSCKIVSIEEARRKKK